MGSVEASWFDALARSSLDAQLVVAPVWNASDDMARNNPADFRFLFANAAAALLFDSTPSDLAGQSLNDFNATNLGEFRQDLRRACANLNPVDSVHDAQIPTPSLRYRIVPFDGLLAVSVAAGPSESDVRTEAVAALRLLEVGIDSSLTASALVRPLFTDGRVHDLLFLRANELVAELLGTTKGALEGNTLYSAIPERTRGIVRLVQTCWDSGSVYRDDYDARESPIRAEWLRMQITRVGDLAWIDAYDISQKRREQTALRESEQRFRAIVEQACELIVLSDEQGLMRYANPFTKAVLGFPAERFVDRPMLEFVVADDRADLLDTYLRMRQGEINIDRRTLRVIDTSGGVRTIVGSSVATHAADGAFSGIVTIGADVTEHLASEEARNELAAALSVAEQTERERLAGELHDGPVQRLAALSMLLGAQSNKSHVDHEVILSAENLVLDSMAELRSLMFRLSPPDLQGLSLGQAIRGRAERIFDGTDTTVSVEVHIETAPPSGVATALFRLAQESLVNARKHAQAHHVAVTLTQQDGNYALRIADDGSGANAHDLQAHRPGHLGLRMIYERSRQLGGLARVMTQPGAGTTVSITVPAS
jgi:PAS domain S-box-containing protein